MIRKIKYVMEHSCFYGIVIVMRKLGIVHLLHILDGKINCRKNKEEGKKFQKFYEQHEKEFKKLSEMLEDDFSRYTLDKVVEYRKTHNIHVLKDIIVQPQYFQKDIFDLGKDEVFIDGGAYVGDTIQDFIKIGGGQYKAIYAWEPDTDNLKQMKKRLHQYKNINIVPCGLWDQKDELGFTQGENATAKISSEATNKIKVDSIDNVCADEQVTLIKMDIEGSEQKALRGAVSVIKRDKPKLAICIYHSPEDLYEIPFWIKSVVPEYKLYIRHHSDTGAETVVYATV